MQASLGRENPLDLQVSSAVLRQLEPLCKKDNYHCLLALAFDYTMIAIAIACCLSVSFWFYPLALILIGSTQRAFVNLLHESTHTTLAKNPRLNLAGGTIFSGYLVFHLFNPYKNSHIGQHHRHLGDPELDPDYNFHLKCGLYNDEESTSSFFLKNMLFAIVGFRSFDYIRYVVKDRVLFKQASLIVNSPITMTTERLVLVVQWSVIIGVCAYFGWLLYLLLFWIVPLFTTAIAVGWLTELAEHYPLPQSEQKTLLLTRNRHGWWIERFLLGRHDDNYHLVHHLRAAIPFFNMKKAHAILLQDPAYRTWDALWGGVLSKNKASEETLLSYLAKYRHWRRSKAAPSELSFAEQVLLAGMPLSAPPVPTAAPATSPTLLALTPQTQN